MFNRGSTTMTVRWLLGVALVTNVLVLVVCTGQTTQATGASSLNASSTKSAITSKPAKCRCRKVKKCPKNEEFSYCPQSIQRAQYCSEKAEPCKTKSYKPCKEGCVCKENYLRADNGTCIPERQCPLTCADNEVLDNCPSNCESDYCPAEEADTFAKPCVYRDVCPPPVCKCGFNRRRAANGSCILTRDCPPFDCTSRPNEKYNACPPLCPTDDCSQASPTGECPPQFGRIGIILPCNPKCRCIEGYWRLNGTCVPYGQCPGVCPDNERYSTCIQGECRALNCTQKDKSVPCIRIDPLFCKKGCVCQEGYLRNKDGICVLEEKCEPGVCPDNERYSTCIQGECRALNCTQKDESVPCIRIDPLFCEKGCVCQEGYLRNKDGICVLEEKCEPGVCPDNERYSTCIQGECRALNCTQKDKSVPCIRIDPLLCKKGCVCQEGYLRNKDGICVLEEKCERPPTCADNEVLDNCPSYCESDSCPATEADTFAKPCVPQDGCPPPACKCSFNHRRAANGSCIPTRDCPPINCTSRPNEEYKTCPPLCPTDDCSQASPTGECPQIGRIGIILHCNPKCRCIEGYWRLNGTCVPYGQCPGVCPDNERYSTCIQGECRALNCTQKDKSVPCIRLDPLFCKKGCVCQEGYLRNKDGICVLEEKCEPTCPADEEFVSCIQGVCRAKDCSERGQDVPCPDIPTEKCDSGCICKEGFLRAENGSCVLEDECETCGENEVLDDCPTKCNTDYCPLSADEKQVCTKADPCVPACKCRFNYKRAENKTCIPTRDCPPFDCSSKPNEEFVACPPLCPTDACYKPRLEGRCPFRIGIILQCQPKCQCKDGYGRENGTCIPFAECSNLCPANETYSPCVQQTCRPQNCTDRDLAMETCPTSDAAECKRGCVCQENYYRNDKGDCVSYEECGGPICPNPHEVYEPNFKECPPNTCNALVAKIRCDENQKVGPGCRCGDGYLRLNATERCVPICECPEMKYSVDCLK